MSNFVKKNKRILTLVSITIVVVLGAAIAISSLSDSSSVYIKPTKAMVMPKIIPAPKKVMVAEKVSTHFAEKVPSYVGYMESELQSDQSLSQSDRQKIESDIASYQDFQLEQQQQNQYLSNINKMSMQLHKLTLQGQIAQQEAAIAKTNAELEKAKSAETASSEQAAAIVRAQQMAVSPVTLAMPGLVTLKMIYQIGHQYAALLSIDHKDFPVCVGSHLMIGSADVIVSDINAQTVILKQGKQIMNLTISDKMESI